MLKSKHQAATPSHGIQQHSSTAQEHQQPALPSTHQEIRAILSTAFASIAPDLHAFNAIITAACTADRLDMAVEYYNRMVSMRVRPNLGTFTPILQSFAKRGDINAAKTVMERMQFMGLTPDLVLYTIMIKLHADKGDIEGMLKMFIAARQNDIMPDARMLNALLHGYGLAGDLNAMGVLYENLVKTYGIVPDEATYTILMNAHANAGELAAARKWLAIATGEALDPITVEAAGQQAARDPKNAGKPRLQPALPPSSIEPGVVPYTGLISALARAGDVSAMAKTVYSMRERGITPNLITYTAIIHGYATAGKMREAVATFNAMLGTRLPGSTSPIVPDHAVFDTIIGGFVAQRHVNSAWRWLRVMEDHGIAPTATTYALVINAHLKLSNFDRACEIYKRMIDRGIEPSEHLLVSMLVHLNRAHRFQRSRYGREAAAAAEAAQAESASSMSNSEPSGTTAEDGTDRLEYVPHLSPLHVANQPGPRGKYHANITHIYSDYQLVKHKTRKPLKLYDAYITHLMAFCRVPPAREVFIDMIKDGCMPDISVMVRMVRGLARTEGWTSVIRLSRLAMRFMHALGIDPVPSHSNTPKPAIATLRDSGTIDPAIARQPQQDMGDAHGFVDSPLYNASNMFGDFSNGLKGWSTMWRNLQNREQFERNLTAVMLAAYGRFAFASHWQSLPGDYKSYPLFWNVDTIKHDRSTNQFAIVGGLTSDAALMSYFDAVVAVHRQFGVPFELTPVADDAGQHEGESGSAAVLRAGSWSGKRRRRKMFHEDVLGPDLSPFRSFFILYLRHCELCGRGVARQHAFDWMHDNVPYE
ncbi:hypothetical protein BC831DRAFT_398768 [Entophlyctis helioformis]|nr:hypothetical protein BC831DRAFT_398768 [Entophlyctis helioformis]